MGVVDVLRKLTLTSFHFIGPAYLPWNIRFRQSDPHLALKIAIVVGFPGGNACKTSTDIKALYPYWDCETVKKHGDFASTSQQKYTYEVNREISLFREGLARNHTEVHHIT